MMRMAMIILLSVGMALGLAACENRNGGGVYVEGTGGVGIGN
jgi:hypothetical protein